jgi:protein-S-isoprenylcysteine O-methyltransferase Ste14
VSRLELRVPPDVVWVAVAGLMWLVSTRTPHLALPPVLRIGASVALTVAGIAIIVSARAALSAANTTWHPTTPDQTSSLVTTGVFAISRNPVYLGMLLVMLGLGVALSSPAALLTSVLLVLYLDRLQIAPEERALSHKLGQEYVDYQARVRRWI